MIRLIASDLDGTLLNKAKEISQFTEKILSDAAAQGIYFVPATGRAFSAVPEEIKHFPGVEYIITSNGAAVYSVSQGKRIYECLMDGKSVDSLLKIPRPENVALEAFVEGIPYSEARYVENPMAYGATEYGAEYVKRTRHPIPDIEAFIRKNKDNLDSIAFVCNEENERKRLREAFGEEKDIYVTSSIPHLLEIGHKDAGKGHTLLWLLKLLEISPSQAAAFGDADNDWEMLSSVKYGFAMENATEKCKTAAYAVTKSNEEDGVGKAVARLLAEEKNMEQVHRAEDLYKKFTESKQQKLRLEAALQGFFMESKDGVETAHREAYASYLKSRIRPAMEVLIREEETEKMEILTELGWFGKTELEQFIRSAREQSKLSALVWLLKLKQEKYGYEDRDFSL